MSPQQKSQFQKIKIATGCINGYAPSHGIILKSDGNAVPYPSVISTVQTSFFQENAMVHIPLPYPHCHVCMVKLPPPPNAIPIVLPAVDSIDDVLVFQKSGSSSNPNTYADNTSTLRNASGNILMVNGCSINE